MTAANSVYLHVPFCVSKCPYCAFASAVRAKDGADEKNEKIYLRALAAEIAARACRAGKIDTLYIGGGTPSVLSICAWRELRATLERAFFFAPDAEVTVEANPGSLTAEHLRLWRDWRVTRVSVGVQSFDDAELALLGRPHTGAQAADAVAACRAAGFAVSLDLMFGLVFGNFRNWARTLREAILLNPHHISIYQLMLEAETPFAKKFSDDDLTDGYAPYRYAQWLLPKKNYVQYEVASFAQPGREARHNLYYWRNDEYLGLGPAAWSYLNGVRKKNAPDLSAYADMIAETGDASVYEESLQGEADARQAAVLALRTRYGIVWREFSARYGTAAAEAIQNDLKQFPADLVAYTPERSVLTPRGLRLANRVWEELIQ